MDRNPHLSTKRQRYAASGVQEYWVIDARSLLTTVHREPRPDGEYAYRDEVQYPILHARSPRNIRKQPHGVEQVACHRISGRYLSALIPPFYWFIGSVSCIFRGMRALSMKSTKTGTFAMCICPDTFNSNWIQR